MTFRVLVTKSAEADAEAAYDWIAERAPEAAIKWFNGLVDIIDSLEQLPARCGMAPESKKAGVEIRQLLYGRRPHVYRILFQIRKQSVYVLHIRHGARQTMSPEDIGVMPPEE